MIPSGLLCFVSHLLVYTTHHSFLGGYLLQRFASSLTCSRLDEHVQNIDGVTTIVQHKVDSQVVILELMKHAAGDDDDDVVEYCQGDDA